MKQGPREAGSETVEVQRDVYGVRETEVGNETLRLARSVKVGGFADGPDGEGTWWPESPALAPRNSRSAGRRRCLSSSVARTNPTASSGKARIQAITA